ASSATTRASCQRGSSAGAKRPHVSPRARVATNRIAVLLAGARAPRPVLKSVRGVRAAEGRGYTPARGRHKSSPPARLAKPWDRGKMGFLGAGAGGRKLKRIG